MAHRPNAKKIVAATRLIARRGRRPPATRPARGTRTEKRVAKARATSWVLSPISARVMTRNDVTNAAMACTTPIRWRRRSAVMKKTLDPPLLHAGELWAEGLAGLAGASRWG